MSVVQLDLPDSYLELARRVAERRRMPLDRVLLDAVKRALAAEEGLAYLHERAERGKDVDIKAILAKAPDVPPMPGDEIDPR